MARAKGGKGDYRKWFPFYATDWTTSKPIRAMGAAGAGAYIALLAEAWQEPDCGLLDDDEQLSVISLLGQEWYGETGRKVRAMFRSENGRLYNDRLLAEFNITMDRMGIAVENANKRWGKQIDTTRMPGQCQINANAVPLHSDCMRSAENDADVMPLHEIGNASAYPLAMQLDQVGSASASALAMLTHIPKTYTYTEEREELSPTPLTVVKRSPKQAKRGWDFAESLQAFLAEYPKQVKRDAAAMAFNSLIETADEFAKLMAGLSRWKASDEWARSLRVDGGRFIPNPDKFIFERRYLDAPEPARETSRDSGSNLNEILLELFPDEEAA